MGDCLFCKIIKGEIPSTKVYEDDKVIAFNDINPVAPYHILVVPKKHVTNMFDVSDEIICEVIKAVNYVTKLLKDKLGIEAVNVINNSGEKAGQTVMHLHYHVIPRYDNDGIVISPKQTEPDFDKLKQVLEEIKK